MKPLNINKKQLIEKYLGQKLSAVDIAKLLNCTSTTVYNYLKKYQINRRNHSEANRLSIYKIIHILKSRKGKNNPMFGKRMSKKTRKLQSKIKIGEKNPMYGRRGKKSPNWNGGSSFYPYSTKWTKQLKAKIRARDNYICQCCQIKQKDYFRKLDVHHVDYNKQNCKENNLITLCWRCNVKANYNRDYWYAYYKYIIENNIYA